MRFCLWLCQSSNCHCLNSFLFSADHEQWSYDHLMKINIFTTISQIQILQMFPEFVSEQIQTII